MKKSSFYIVIIATSVVLPTFSLPSFATDCPVIPIEVKTVTAANNPSLRKEPKKGELDPNRPTISSGDSLNVLDNKPTENEKHCWYKVNPVKNQNQDQQWWIAGDIGLKEFSSWQNPKDSPSPPVSSLIPPNKGQGNTPKASPVSPLLWLAIALGGIGTLGSIGTLIFCILRFSKLEDFLEGFRQTINPRLDKLDKTTKQSQNNVKILSDYNLSLKEVFTDIEKRMQSLEQKQSSLLTHNPVNTPVAVSAVAQIPVPAFEIPVKKSMTDEMIEQFNSQNRDYFRDAKFQPLTLTQQSIQGQVGLDARRIVQLEVPSDSSQASYLTTEIDRENWLIPNITSPYISQIMRNLHENPEIFTVEPGSGTLRLIKPAKLKSFSSGLWEIEEPGAFQG